MCYSMRPHDTFGSVGDCGILHPLLERMIHFTTSIEQTSSA